MCSIGYLIKSFKMSYRSVLGILVYMNHRLALAFQVQKIGQRGSFTKRNEIVSD